MGAVRLNSLEQMGRKCSLSYVPVYLPVFSHPLSKQVFATAETIQLAPTVRSVAMGTMEIRPRVPPLIASPARVLGAQVVQLSLRPKRWYAPTVQWAPPVSLLFLSAVSTASYKNTLGESAVAISGGFFLFGSVITVFLVGKVL